jgi:hypothetical protein
MMAFGAKPTLYRVQLFFFLFQIEDIDKYGPQKDDQHKSEKVK